MEAHVLKYVVLAMLGIMAEFRDYGGSLYLALVISGVVVVPIFSAGMRFRESLLLYASLALAISTAVLTGFNFLESAFFCFLHVELIICLRTHSFYSMLVVLIETYAMFIAPAMNRYVVLLLGLNMFACLSLCIAFSFRVESMFSGGTTLMTALISIVVSKSVNVPMFLMSCLLSLPRLPFPIPQQPINDKNRRMLTFTVVSFSANFIGLIYGLKRKSVTMQSSNLKAISTNIAMFGVVLADLAGRIPPDKTFQLGYERITVICSFAVSILLLYFSYESFAIVLSSLLSTGPLAPTTGPVFWMSMAKMAWRLCGLFYLGTVNAKTCSLAEGGSSALFAIDMVLETSDLVSSFLSYIFKIAIFDAYVMLASSAVLFMISVPRLIKQFAILLELAPKGAKSAFGEIEEVQIVQFRASQVTRDAGISVTACVMTMDAELDRLWRKLEEYVRSLRVSHASFEVLRGEMSAVCV